MFRRNRIFRTMVAGACLTWTVVAGADDRAASAPNGAGPSHETSTPFAPDGSAADAFDRAAAPDRGRGSLDCDNNGTPDDEEIIADPSLDCNSNGILDVCDVDPSDPDGDTLVFEDCDGDLVPDECQTSTVVLTEGFEDIETLTGDGWVMLNHSTSPGTVGWFQGNSFPAQSGSTNSYIAANWLNTGSGTISNWLLTPEMPLSNGLAFSFYTRTIAFSSAPDRMQLLLSVSGASQDVGTGPNEMGDFTQVLEEFNRNLLVGGYPEVWTQHVEVLDGIEPGTTGRFAFRYWVTNAGPTGSNSLHIGIDSVNVAEPLDDCNGNGTLDECEEDCNTNGLPDDCDITDGTSLDCNTNGTPDECDIAGGGSDCNSNGTPDDCEEDCNTNGVADACDISGGTSTDCDSNGTPDECEDDCNTNGIADGCDIVQGTSSDCNTNGMPDECEEDCNSNGVPDECDIDDGTGQDCNSNGTLDECEVSEIFLAEGFDDINPLIPNGWVMINNSDPLGVSDWFQGTTEFTAQAGGDTSYIAANFENCADGTGPDTINNWLLTPEFDLSNGMSLSFYTRTVESSGFPDRLEVRLSLAGASQDVGVGALDVGDFTTTLLQINDNLDVGGYPEAWQEYVVVLGNIEAGASGRFAFRYFVTDAGLAGTNSNFVGIDSLSIGLVADDCNANGTPDECEADCNTNGTPDDCDIANGNPDCNSDGIPDECEGDCNNNSTPDGCDIADGTSLDCNTNGIPDECDLAGGGLDCNSNHTPDECEVDCNTSGVPDDCDIRDGTSTDCDGNDVPDECEDDCNSNGTGDECDIADETSLDCNTNGIPDECEEDCNTNGTPDGCDIAAEEGLDCDTNGVLDECEIAVEPGFDCNSNGVLDVCDVDESDPDGDEQVSQDCNANQTPDECEVGEAILADGFGDIDALAGDGWVMINSSEPIGVTGWLQGDGTFVAQAGEDNSLISANFENCGDGEGSDTISNWLITPEIALSDGLPLSFYTRTIEASVFADRLEVRLSLAGPSQDVGTGAAEVGDFSTLLLEINPSLEVGGYPEAWERHVLVLEGIPPASSGRFAFRYFVTDAGPTGAHSNYIGIDSVVVGESSADCNANGTPDECEDDCNTNGVPDDCDIEGGASPDCNEDGTPDDCEDDCNTNGVPDDCDIADGASRDCNTNGVPDDCDISDGASLDCNGNGTPDTCERDCNANGVPDDCDLRTGAAQDCNRNGVPDECDSSGNGGLDCNANGVLDECEEDCDSNGVPDACDLTDGTDLDCNANGVPDACDISTGTSTDADTNGVPDECESTPDGQPDPGGSDGQPDPGGSDGKLVDRITVRSILSAMFNVPADGRDTLGSLPVKVFGVFGIQMGVALTLLEWLNLPVRMFLFEIFYGFLDAILP